MALRARFLMVGLVWLGSPTRLSVPPCSRPSRTLRAAEAVARRRPSLTAAARDGTDCVEVGTEGWCRSNKRMGLPNTASRTLYRVREAEVPILSAAITVMKKISFRSILLRPSYCARPIRSPDFKPLCYRRDRPILWATLTVETKRKPSRILIRKFGESHQKPCSGSEAKTQATGKKPGGKPPQPPAQGALPTDQINLTDEESRIMPVAGGGFEQCYNAQAVVAADSLLVVAAQVVQAPNDKQQIEPMLKRIEALPADLGKPETLLADNGYFSDANVELCAAAQIDPMIALGRQSHHPSLAERFAKAPPAPENPTPLAAMSHRLQTPEGKKLYALRKQIPAPVFGIIKSVMGFRQFLLRGLDQA